MAEPINVPVEITSSGDTVVVSGTAGHRIGVTSFLLDANGNDMIVTVKSGGSGGGSNVAITGPMSVGPLAGNSGLAGSRNADGHFVTLPLAKPAVDDLVFNVELVSGGAGSINLTGYVKYVPM